jgi:hypothetical protein
MLILKAIVLGLITAAGEAIPGRVLEAAGVGFNPLRIASDGKLTGAEANGDFGSIIDCSKLIFSFSGRGCALASLTFTIGITF